ncbi:hypothetical protein BC939DRAFT_434979, partial [Gamsiella multidivaricata]|uniref:uncharacterized protein n=1 Tax=Gamsiella multidivaricata TaxID=101098 RepID=UPI00221F4FEA
MPTGVGTDTDQDTSPVESPTDFLSVPGDDPFQYLSDVASPSSDIESPPSGAVAANSPPNSLPLRVIAASPDRYLHLRLNGTPTRSLRRREE